MDARRGQFERGEKNSVNLLRLGYNPPDLTRLVEMYETLQTNVGM